MPVEQLIPRRAASPEAQLVQYDQYIDTQIRSTRRAVKLVDLATALVLLASGILAYLLVVALVEHWLVPGGFSMPARTVLFAALAGGTAYFAYKHIWPLCARAINPVYAARAIEQSSPSLKNTLVNLLLFRQKRSEVSDAVYRTLEEQAAQRLTRVPIDAAVDRGQLIRFGYVLVGVVAFAAVYKIASPKDPIVTAERVLMPWANIVPASRVQIAAIAPGDVTIARGEYIDVAAEVRGIGEDDAVFLRYTTADGQAVRKPISMKAAAGGLKFECRLPDTTDAGGFAGVGQNLTYRIEAGDARSLDFTVNVVTAPAILVERVDYDYPLYTDFVDRTVDGVGDIRAIEGTKVTIHARANSPIREAFIDFDADGRRDIPLTAEGTNGKVSFTLSLRDDRQTPKFASYVLRFTNDESRSNRDPVKYPIEVLRDIDPEVTLVAPREKTVDVRLDQTVTIEVDARDPDFALSEVRLRGETIGRPEINAPLLTKSHVGRYTAKYQFTPKEHQLRAGDIVHYWATASDNRAPTANTAATEKRTIRIAAPDAGQQQQQPNGANQNGQRRQQPGQNQQQEKQQPNNQAQNQSNQNQNGGGEAAPANGQSGTPDANSKQTPGERMNAAQDKQEKQEKQNPTNNAAQGNNQPNQDNNNQAGGEAQANQTGQSGDSQNKQGNQEQTGAGAAGGGTSKDGSRPSGARPDMNTGSGSQSTGNDSQGDKNNASQSPISSKGDNDAEAIRRMRDHLQEKGEIKKDEPQSNSPQNNSQQNNAAQNRPQQSGDKQNGDPQKAQPQSGQTQNGKQTDSNTSKGGNPQDGKQQDSKQPGGSQQTDSEKNGKQQGGGSPNAEQQNNRAQNNSDATANRGRSPTGKQQEGTPNANQNDAAKQQGDPNSKDGTQQLSGARGNNGERRGGSEKQPGDAANDGKQAEGQRDGSRSSRGAGSSSTDPNGKSTEPGQDERLRKTQSGADPDQKFEQTPSTDPASNKQNDGAPGRHNPNSNGEQGEDLPKDSKDSVTNKDVKRDGGGKTGQGKPADQGAGAAGEHGPGNDSSNAGRDVPSAEKTGQAGRDTAGKGSTQKDGRGDQPGGKAGNTQSGNTDPNNKTNDPTNAGGERGGNQNAAQPNGNGEKTATGDARPTGNASKSGEPGASGKTSPGDKSNAARSQDAAKQDASKGSPQPGQAGGNNSQSKDANPTTEKSEQAGTPDGSGGESGANNGTPRQADGESPGADAANLDYARKQTDMVLEKLSEQLNRKQVDKSLLQKLGWSEDDLRKFMSRWNGRKEAASKPDASADGARRELDEALKSLGLRSQELRQSQVKDDNKRDANSGFRGSVPLEYQKRLEDYNRGVSRSRGNQGQK